MRKTLLALVAGFAALSAVAVTPISATSDQSMSSRILDLKMQMLQREAGLPAEISQPAQLPVYNWEGTDTITYFVGAQTFMNGWQFDVNGGDSRNYEMGVLRDGNRVVLTNLFDAYDPTSWAANYDFPIEGVYDPEAGTITVDLPVDAMSVYGSYIAQLVATTEFDEYGNIPEGAELSQMVFNVTDDFKTITAATYFGAKYAWGWTERFKTFTAIKEDPNDPAVIVKVGDDIVFGTTYAGKSIEKTFALLNMGGQPGEYTITIEDANDAFQTFQTAGAVNPYAMEEIVFEFVPQTAGSFTAVATIEIAGADPITVNLAGEALDIPDYSAIVKAGDFTFDTVIDYPAVITEVAHPLYDEAGNPVLDENGEAATENITVARMATGGLYGSSSLKAFFEIPDGKMGKLTFKGHYSNPSNVSWKGAGFILYDDEDYYDGIYQTTQDLPADITYREFAPGEHFLYVVCQDAQSYSEDLCTYIWDLNLEIVDPSDNPPVALTPEVFLGYGIAGEGQVTEKIATIEIQNKSNRIMKIESITCDYDEFDYSIPGYEAGLLETITIPIEMIAETPGDKVANFTIVTNLGTVEAKATAKTCLYPDYASLVSEGLEYMDFYVNYTYPFMVEDGKTYNITSQHPDDAEIYASFGFYVNIPEGYLGQLVFKGHSWGTPTDMYAETSYWDFGGVSVRYAERFNNIDGFTACFYDNDVEVSQNYWAEIGDGDFSEYTLMPEGLNTVEFFYQQGGDKKWYDQDRVELSMIGVSLKSTGIIDVKADEIISKEYYNLMGVRLAQPENGICIERTRYADGRTVSRKVMINK